MDFLPRLGALFIAAAILFAALRFHKSSGPHSAKAKKTGAVLAFIAGMAFLVTIVGDWMGKVAAIGGALGAALLIIAVATIVVDWGMDKRPDKPAFWAMFALPALLVFGVTQIPAVADQIGDGGRQVSEQMNKVGK